MKAVDIIRSPSQLGVRIRIPPELSEFIRFQRRMERGGSFEIL